MRCAIVHSHVVVVNMSVDADVKLSAGVEEFIIVTPSLGWIRSHPRPLKAGEIANSALKSEVPGRGLFGLSITIAEELVLKSPSMSSMSL